MISVVIPTIQGREHWLERAVASYERTMEEPFELIILNDHPHTGSAWQEGGERAKGDYVFLSADDIEALPGWWPAAVAKCDEGKIPAPLIYNSDRTVQSCGASWLQLEPDDTETGFTRLPFLSKQQFDAIQPMLPCHYFTDNWVSWRGRVLGYPTFTTHKFRLVHHLAPEGRNEARAADEAHIYKRAIRGEDVWSGSS